MERKWELVGKLATVSVWTTDKDFDLDIVEAEVSEHFKNVIRVRNFYIAFTDGVYWQGYTNFLMDFEKIIQNKQKLIKTAEWLEDRTDWAKTIEHYILEEKEVKNKIYWKNDLQQFDVEYELTLLNKGIVRECTMEDGSVKKIAQGAEIFKMIVCRVDEGLIVCDKHLEEGYLYLIHYTSSDEKVLLKFYLRKWGWYLFKDKQARRFLLNNIEDENYVNNLNLEVAQGMLYPD